MSIVDFGKMEKSMDSVDTHLQMETSIKVSLLKEWGLEKESIHGLTVVFTRGNGEQTKWTVMEYIELLME